MVSLIATGQSGYSCEAKILQTVGGVFRVTLPPESSFVWKNLLPWGNQRNKENLECNFR